MAPVLLTKLALVPRDHHACQTASANEKPLNAVELSPTCIRPADGGGRRGGIQLWICRKTDQQISAWVVFDDEAAFVNANTHAELQALQAAAGSGASA